MKKNIFHNCASIVASIIFTLGAGFGQVHAGVVTSSLDDGNLGSLRQIMAHATSGETITFDPGLNGKTITLTNGQLVLTKNVQVVGPGANQLTISGGATTRVFYVANGVSATISGLTIANGNGSSPIPGGGGATGGVVLANTGTNVATGGSLVISTGTIPGNAVLTTNASATLLNMGSGTLTITGANTYTGSTTVNAGSLTLNNGTNSGTLSATSLPTTVNLGTITNVGGIVTTGAGATILTGANTYTGSTTVSGGTLAVNPGAVLSTGAKTVGTNNLTSGTLAVGAAAPGPTNAGALTLSGGTVNNFGGTLTNNGAVTTTTTGGSIGAVNSSTTPSNSALTLTGIPSSTSNAISSSTLLVRSTTPVSTTGVILVLNGGATTSTGGTLGTITLGNLPGNLVFGGTVILTGGNTFTGSTTINAGGGFLFVAASGAGIYNDGGILIVRDCTISNNTNGGGIDNRASLSVTTSTVSITGSLKLINCTVSGNSGPLFGGIHNGGLATAVVINSTVTGNTGLQAGAIFNDVGALFSLSNSTVSGNAAQVLGGGSPGGVFMVGGTIIFSAAPVPRIGTLVVDDTIFSNNAGGNFLAYPGVTTTSNGYNLSDDATMATFLTGPGDLNNTPAGLDADAQGKPRLQDNGGPTPTIALLPGSAAIDKGNPAFNPNPPLPSDQRGFPRIANGRLDIGAFETQTPRSLTIAVQRALQAIPATNDPTGHAFHDVLDRLTSSLGSMFWVDDTHLSMEGDSVFDADHFAVDQLAKIVQAHGPVAADVQDWIDYLVNADEVLAKVAIHDAAAGDPKKLAEANQEFTLAEQALEQDKFPEGVDHFSHAWEKALQAISKIPVVPAGS